MSFSGDVKEELVRLDNDARHCQIAELAAILVYAQAIKKDNAGKTFIEIQSDAPYIASKSLMLLDKLFNLKYDNLIHEDNHSYLKICDDGSNITEKILQTIKYTDKDMLVNPMVIKSLCCKRAYLRGAFLATGSMSNPEKGYHLELVCEDISQAEHVVDTLEIFNIRAKIVARKKYQVVYIKESEEIVEFLNVTGAHISLMNLENLRILKDMRNSINRRVNCETANITKTVNAAAKQIEDIKYIKQHYGFGNLPDNLRQMAEIRLDYPDATLKELGQYLVPAVGKSGVNHRLRKLSELAEKLKNN